MHKYWKLFPIFLIVLGCTAVSSNKTKSADDSDIDTIYLKRCAGCHGTDGTPRIKPAPDFTDPKFQKSLTDEQMLNSITNGKDPRMPAYGEILEKEEIKQLVTYIRDFAPKQKK